MLYSVTYLLLNMGLHLLDSILHFKPEPLFWLTPFQYFAMYGLIFTILIYVDYWRLTHRGSELY